MRIVTVKVIVRASKCSVIQQADGILKVKLTHPALEGRANGQLREVLADYFSTSKTNIHILSGERTSIKRIEVK